MTGLDTGFFVLVSGQHRRATGLWTEILEGRRDAAVSALTLFELERLGLRGEVPSEYVATALETIPIVCRFRWLDDLELIRRGARLSQGHKLSLADSLILASLLAEGCEEIYTTDSDLESYRSKQVTVHRLVPESWP